MDEKGLRKFLSYYEFKNRKEGIEYIIKTIQKAESEKKILSFDALADDKYIPNPILDCKGKLLFDTKTIIEAYDEWVRKSEHVNTEIAQLVRENYLIMRDIANTPLKEIR